MAQQQKAATPRSKSANFWTDVLTVAMGAIYGLSTLLSAPLDTETAGQIGAQVPEVVNAAQNGAWALLVVGVVKLGNIIYHLFKG